jgi:hypothetical protein
VGFAMVVIGIVFFWLTHLALVALNRGLAASEGPAYFVLLPQTAIWWFFPGFGALSLSWELTLLIWTTFGNQKEADLYDAWSSQKAGFDSRRVLRLMALFILAPIGLLTCLALREHDTLHDAEIRSTGFASRNRTVYRYSDARRLATIEGSEHATENSRVGLARWSILLTVIDGHPPTAAISEPWSIPHYWTFFSRRLDCRCSTPKPKLISDLEIGTRTSPTASAASSRYVGYRKLAQTHRSGARQLHPK